MSFAIALWLIFLDGWLWGSLSRYGKNVMELLLYSLFFLIEGLLFRSVWFIALSFLLTTVVLVLFSVLSYRDLRMRGDIK